MTDWVFGIKRNRLKLSSFLDKLGPVPNLPLRFVSERCHKHAAFCFDFTGIFVELRFIGTHDHLPVANQLATFADRKTNWRFDFYISLHLNNGWIGNASLYVEC